MAPHVQEEMAARQERLNLEKTTQTGFATPDFPFSYVDSINLPVLILFSCLYHCFKRILSEKPGCVLSLGASNLFYSLMRASYTPRVLTRGAVVHCLFFAVDYFCNFHCIAHHVWNRLQRPVVQFLGGAGQPLHISFLLGRVGHTCLWHATSLFFLCAITLPLFDPVF